MNARLRLVGTADVPETEALPGALLPGPVHYLGESSGALTELEPESLSAHRRRVGERPSCTGPAGSALLEALDEAALTGRGGGHFPTARKLQAARAAGATVVVANGAEGEPLSRKDAALLELRPHLVLDGLACVAEFVGARSAVVWLHESAHPARAAVARALAERQGHEKEPALRIALGPDHYLTGESSAVLRGVSGGPALPVFRRAPGTSGLVHNVETLARTGLLVRGVAAADTVLVSASHERAIVVLEVPDQCGLADAATAATGSAPVQALLVGGFGGSWVPWTQARHLPLAESSLRAHGLSLGAGVLHALPAGSCGLARAASIAATLSAASARQCGPCLHGLAAIASSMSALVRGGRRHRGEVARLEAFVATVRGRGACNHPDGAARMVASALRVFEEDVSAHLRGRCLHATAGRRRG
ncbi:MAG TPA: NADH-ubiquinone oxidoreductase-F iron-sulfur binding region domain-containing protein [Jatrophihabitans sp.]|nr:NADH-ubiquinone oxidoreductase-F iron-sulfur binding region domain-containing protein [Jatrophihabitans sp.]